MREVPVSELLLLLPTFALLVAARIALRVVPVKKIIGWRRRRLRVSGAGKEEQAEWCRRVRWAVLVVARYAPVRFVCFPQCLAASALLASRGIGSRLHYGVRRAAGTAKLETHTWLEAGGEIVIGGEVAGNYARLEVY